MADLPDIYIPEGEGILQTHARGQEIAEMLAVLNDVGSRIRSRWAEQSRIIEAEFGVAIKPDDLKRAVVRYILPQIVVPDGYHKAALLSEVENLNSSKEMFRARDIALQALIEGAAKVGQFIEGERGGSIRTGPTHKELVQMAKEYAALALSCQDELERYGLGPERKNKGGPAIDVNINLDAANGSFFRGYGNQPPMDATFTEKDSDD